MSDTYVCAQCHGTFPKIRSDAEAETEAEEFWGVHDAANDPSMAVVCDDCFKAMLTR